VVVKVDRQPFRLVGMNDPVDYLQTWPPW
jgi:hypothetical protein